MRFLQGLLALMMLSLVGCKSISIEGGHLPKQYLLQAKKLEGRYVGSFEGTKAEIVLFLRGDRPILKYVDQTSKDILGADCQSKIGLLQAIMVENKNGRESLGPLEFGFDPGHCVSVQGRQVILRFLKRNQFEIRILDHRELEGECDPRFPPPYNGHRCGTPEVPVYREGYFTKYR